MQKGVLYIVATPIGNLKDITFRAIDVLKQVDCVISEDTRETQKLFQAYQIQKPQISYREQNHNAVVGKIVDMLASGNNLALVSDSGTPLISDPGFKLVRTLLDAGYEVVSVPGASSVISSLVISGLPTDKFCFIGFLPRTKSVRSNLITEFGVTESTLIFLESPFRLVKLLEEISVCLGDRTIAVAGELTKLHEKVIRGHLNEVLSTLKGQRLRGEFVVLVAKEGF